MDALYFPMHLMLVNTLQGTNYKFPILSHAFNGSQNSANKLWNYSIIRLIQQIIDLFNNLFKTVE